MKIETWLPILTLGLGWGLAQFTEVLKDRRTSTRERLARRAELQRTTLLELQEVLAEVWQGTLFKLTVEMLRLDEDEQEEPWRSTVEASHNLAAHRGRAKLLASRVGDKCVRELSAAVVEASNQVSTEVRTEGPDYRRENSATLKKLEAGYSMAVARIGELLRERY
jgi:hypothetical protein